MNNKKKFFFLYGKNKYYFLEKIEIIKKIFNNFKVIYYDIKSFNDINEKLFFKKDNIFLEKYIYILNITNIKIPHYNIKKLLNFLIRNIINDKIIFHLLNSINAIKEQINIIEKKEYFYIEKIDKNTEQFYLWAKKKVENIMININNDALCNLIKFHENNPYSFTQDILILKNFFLNKKINKNDIINFIKKNQSYYDLNILINNIFNKKYLLKDILYEIKKIKNNNFFLLDIIWIIKKNIYFLYEKNDKNILLHKKQYLKLLQKIDIAIKQDNVSYGWIMFFNIIILRYEDNI